MTVNPAGDYDDSAAEYRIYTAKRDRAGVDGDRTGIMPRLLEFLRDVGGQRVLDAGCGDRYLGRLPAVRGARVTGIDISRRLISSARALERAGDIDYRVADLSRRQPDLAAS